MLFSQYFHNTFTIFHDISTLFLWPMPMSQMKTRVTLAVACPNLVGWWICLPSTITSMSNPPGGCDSFMFHTEEASSAGEYIYANIGGFLVSANFHSSSPFWISWCINIIKKYQITHYSINHEVYSICRRTKNTVGVTEIKNFVNIIQQI